MGGRPHLLDRRQPGPGGDRRRVDAQESELQLPLGRWPPQEKAYADAETEHILFSLLYSLDCYWMSHPVALRGANWKGEQLLRAARMGFSRAALDRHQSPRQRRRLPGDGRRTASSSSPSPRRHWRRRRSLRSSASWHRCRRPASPPSTRRPSTAVGELPCFFQHYVPKRARAAGDGDRRPAVRRAHRFPGRPAHRDRLPRHVGRDPLRGRATLPAEDRAPLPRFRATATA